MVRGFWSVAVKAIAPLRTPPAKASIVVRLIAQRRRMKRNKE
jgi:hypothetical protein